MLSLIGLFGYAFYIILVINNHLLLIVKHQTISSITVNVLKLYLKLLQHEIIRLK